MPTKADEAHLYHRKTTMPVKLILFVVLSLLPQLAWSQIYKCKNTNGEITYSEKLCPSGTIGAPLYLEPNTIESSELRRQIATQKKYETTPSLQTKTTINSESSDTLMSEDEKKIRLRGLLIDMNDEKASYEKKADARNEHGYLFRNQALNLSYDDELKRRNLKVDLGSHDKSKRLNALRLLSAIYVNYQSQ